MTKHINEYTVDELSNKIEAIKAEREKTANALKRYEEELERRKQEDSQRRLDISNLYEDWLKALVAASKREPIDIKVLLPLLKKGYVAMDKCGNWYWYEVKPKCRSDVWTAEKPAFYLSVFNIKPAENWETSLMECGL